MSLASSIAALAARIGFEVKTKIDATHPGRNHKPENSYGLKADGETDHFPQ